MRPLPAPLPTLLPKIIKWANSSKGIVACVKQGPITEFYVVSDEDLAEIDPRAPFIMAGMWRDGLMMVDEGMGKTIHSMYFERALLLQDTGIRLVNDRGAEVYMSSVVAAYDAPDINRVQIIGTGYVVSKTTVPSLQNQTVIYPTELAGSTVQVTTTFLDEEYPGWRERYQAAKLVGYEGGDAAAFIFEVTPIVPAADISSVDFR